MSDYGEESDNTPNYQALKPKSRSTAVAIKDGDKTTAPIIKAAARGALADKILQIAFENDIKVREDADLADLLATFELDSPIPSEALMAVAEILSYVYRANGQADPFNAMMNDTHDPLDQNEQ